MIINKCLSFNNLYRRFSLCHFSTKMNFDDILPDHLTYNIPKYIKNPESLNFPWLVNGAPQLEIKVSFKLSNRLDFYLIKYSLDLKLEGKKFSNISLKYLEESF